MKKQKSPTAPTGPPVHKFRGCLKHVPKAEPASPQRDPVRDAGLSGDGSREDPLTIHLRGALAKADELLLCLEMSVRGLNSPEDRARYNAAIAAAGGRPA